MKDDVLGRCLVLQKANQAGMDDLGIRNNLIGLIIGAIPTISKACVQVLDQLLDRPRALESAQVPRAGATTHCSPRMCSRRFGSTPSIR